VAVDRLADGIGQGSDRAHVGRDPGEPLGRQLEPVEQRRMRCTILRNA
jgi:hypothetical protein